MAIGFHPDPVLLGPPPLPPVRRTVRALTPSAAPPQWNAFQCVRLAINCSDQGFRAAMAAQNSRRSGPPPDYYTIGVSACAFVCLSVSFTTTRFGEGYFGAGIGLGFGAGITIAPGFINTRARFAHTESWVNNFVSKASVTYSAGAGPIGAAETWGSPSFHKSNSGGGDWASEPGLQYIGAGVSEQVTYSWDMGRAFGGPAQRYTPEECGHVGLCN
jgi:hypothetical protein